MLKHQLYVSGDSHCRPPAGTNGVCLRLQRDPAVGTLLLLKQVGVGLFVCDALFEYSSRFMINVFVRILHTCVVRILHTCVRQ